MNPAMFLTAALWLVSAAPQIGAPVPHTPLRNTFLVSAETVVDNAMAIDPAVPDGQFDPLMHQLKQSQATLKDMAAEDGEQEIVTESSNLIFTISACHIQARDASKAGPCRAQIAHAINQVMIVLNHHKSNSGWLEGPPA